MFTEKDLCLIFYRDKLLIAVTNINCLIPVKHLRELNVDEDHYYPLGKFEGKNVVALNFYQPIDDLNSSYTFIPVRELLSLANEALSRLIIRAKQLINWHHSSLFCGSCGYPTVINTNEHSKTCSSCHRTIFPSTSPAIIVLVQRANHILLARSPHFPPGMYSTLAGFVEAGESCEEALRREVQEEVGIAIKNIEYFGSQAWPFPNSFMIAFKAQYDKVKIKTDLSEIEDARWFNKNNLPKLPHESSIAMHLINSFLKASR